MIDVAYTKEYLEYVEDKIRSLQGLIQRHKDQTLSLKSLGYCLHAEAGKIAEWSKEVYDELNKK
jgi:hypothetical protein